MIDPTPATLNHFLASIDMDAFYVDPDVARVALRDRAMFNIHEQHVEGRSRDPQGPSFSVEELSRRSVQRVAEIEVPAASAEDTISRSSNGRRKATPSAGLPTSPGTCNCEASL